MKDSKNYYKEIDGWVKAWEDLKPYRKDHSVDKICFKIGWCWKFRKITSSQKDELCDRMIDLMDNLSSTKMLLE